MTVQALVDSVNADGGIDGHHLSLITRDDASSLSGALTAVESLAGDGVAGIDFDSATVDGGAAQYLARKQIPTTGLADSASWLNDKNMFGVAGYTGTGVATPTTLGLMEKSLGVSKISAIDYGNIAPSTEAAHGYLDAANRVGVQSAGSIDVPLSGNDWTVTALQLKRLGVGGFTTTVSGDDNVALGRAMNQQGIRLPGAIFATGYEKETAEQSGSFLQGTYWTSLAVPFESTSAAAQQYRQLLNKYAPGVFGGSQETFAYLGADLLIAGLEKDHGSSSQSDLETAISQITDFTGGGLLPTPVDYAKPKTTQVSGLCAYLLEIRGDAFVQVGSKPVCGQV